ncbi:MAG: FtsW/RodA/SpoVE family cell cycle protein [Candidatus Brocadiia bacterium]
MHSFSFRDLEWNLLVPISLLLVLSLSMIYDLHGFERASYQLIWILLSIGLMLIILAVDYRSLTRIAVLLYPVMIVALILVLFTDPINGARSWFRFGKFSLQPSEFTKPVLILTLAAYIPFREFYKRFFGLIPPLALTLLPTFLVILQPDLGTALLFIPIFFVIVIFAGAKPANIVMLIVLAFAVSPILYSVMEEHQQQRIQAYLNPSHFSKTVGTHLEQAKIAIGAGGITGYSPGEDEPAPHNSFLVFASTDYAFAVVGEQYGFLGSVAILLLYLWIVMAGYNLTIRTRDPVGKLFVAGSTGMIAAQAVLHIGGNLHLLPFTGVPCPFLSYGGSAAMASIICVALMQNVAMRKRLVFGGD